MLWIARGAAGGAGEGRGLTVTRRLGKGVYHTAWSASVVAQRWVVLWIARGAVGRAGGWEGAYHNGKVSLRCLHHRGESCCELHGVLWVGRGDGRGLTATGWGRGVGHVTLERSLSAGWTAEASRTLICTGRGLGGQFVILQFREMASMGRLPKVLGAEARQSLSVGKLTQLCICLVRWSVHEGCLFGWLRAFWREALLHMPRFGPSHV